MKKIFNIYTIILTIALLNVCTDIQGQTASQNQYNIGIPVLTNIWVDPLHGNDSNSGATRSQSIKSLKEAWNRIPSETTLNTTGYNIMLASGNYSEDLLPGNGWMESRYGTYQFPIIIQSADGSLTAHLHGYLNFFNCRYIYLIGLDFVTDPGYGNGGNVIHLADCNHILIRDCKLNGFDGAENQPQETLKANQAQYLYVENSDISGAFWFPLDFVAVQYGHIIDSRIHNAGDWCMVLKGGSAYFTIERNEIYNGVTGGFTAGQGTGFEFMVPPWLHYEAYDIKFINNIIHDTDGAGIGVNGGYNILFAYNTLYRVGKRSHTIEVAFGLRGCDGNTSKSKEYLSLGGWGTQITGREEPIPNRNIYIYNNIVYNPSGYQSQWSHFAIYGPRTPSQGTNISSPAVTDANLRIRGNVIWNGPVNHPLGIEESDQGAQPSNPTCNETLLKAENSINTIKPQILDPDNNNFKPVPNSNIFTVTSYKIPDFPNNDRPQPPLSPNSSLNNTVTYDYDGNLRTSSNPPGAYANESTIKNIPSLSEILSACEFLNDGDIPLDTFSPPQNALYVAAAAFGGNDNNNGTSINSPLEHLDKAIEYANNHPNTPLTIYLRGGTYYYKTCDLYQTIDRGNLYVTSYQNEDVTIRPPCWPNNPTSWFDERAFQINGPYENITFDNLKFEGWEIIFNPGAPLNTQPLKNLTIKNITASNFTHRYGDTNFLRTFLETAYLLDNVYGPGKEIFNNPDNAKYQIEGLILKNITITDADMAINIGDENDANVKGMRITQVKLQNPPQQGGDSSSDAFAIVNSYKILIDHCDIENVCDDGIDTKSYNVSVVNSFITGTGRNAVKFWRNGELINSIIYNCTAINDGALIVDEGPCRVINSILMKKSVGYAGTFNYDGTSSAKFEIINSIFMDLDHTFYVGTGNLQSKNCLYYDMPGGLFSGQVSADTIQNLNTLSNCSGNISSNPLFINPENKDFRTNINSPCIDKGTSAGVTLPSFDYYGNSRIAGNSPDIGPFEYNSTLTVKEGDLETFITSIESSMPGKDSELYTDPTTIEKIAFQDIVTYLLNQDIIPALSIANELNYEIIKFTETSNNSIYYILKEKTPVTKGWGTYIFNPNPKNELIIEIPHPVYEFKTCKIGIETFIKEKAKVFLLAGTHRYANADGTSDVAHNPDCIFELVHETILNFGVSKVVQIHGFSLEKHPGYPDIVLSDGTLGPLPECYKLKINLEAIGLTVGIYNGFDYSDLGATENLQGQYTNSEGKEFYHIELSNNLRSDPVKINIFENILGTLFNNVQLASVKNIIIFIGDGMGPEQVKAGRIFTVGPNGYLNFESLDISGEVTTNSLSGVTDSAAAATAISAGHKVYNGYVSQDQNNTEYKTILEYAKTLGKRTGIVTTTEITDATPACFGAHTNNRNNWNEIANDYIYGSQPNIIFGGGKKYWLPSTEPGSVRSDNGLIDDAETKGYVYVDTSTELDCLNMDTEDKVLGLFSLDNMSYEYNKAPGTTEPDLSILVDKALDLLEEDPDGFFLMIEGGHIDNACHSNNITNIVYEIEEFDDAILTTLSWAISHPDTLIIVTADHETGGLQVINGNYVMGQIPNVTWSTTGHTSENVPVWFNSFSGSLPNPIDNTDIFKYMLESFLKETNKIIKDWPCGSGTLIGHTGNLGSAYEPSGIIWHSRLNKLVVISDEGDITTMDTNGNNITTWHVGGDIEAVTIADANSKYIYIGIENPDSIKEFNIETGQLTGKSWDLTTWMTGPANSGLEALTFVPNGKHPYSYTASGGLFYAGLQCNGKIYVFDVDLAVNGKVSYIGTITPIEGVSDISDLYYNTDTDILYAIFDGSNLLVEMEPNGKAVKEYKLPGNEQEGITVIPLTPLSIAQVYIAEDTPPKIWKYTNYPLRTVTLTINSNSGGTTNPVPGSYEYDGGTTVTISANPATGYTFNNWSGSQTGTTNPVTITMDTDKTITANFSMTPSNPPSPSMPNLATSSTVTTSSEYSAGYNSLKTIDGIKGIWDQGEWASKGEMTPWIKFRWNSPQLINKVILYDRSNPIDHIKDAWLYLNKYGQRISSIHLGMFPYGGSAKEVVFDAIEADEITIVITEGTGINIGLSEFMAYYDTDIPDTDNLALQCSVNASSYYNETYRPELAVDGKYGLWDEYEWTSKGEMTPWIKFRWNSPQLINKVILYDRSNPIDHIKDAWMYLNKYGQRVNSIHLGMFPYGGSAKEVVFDAIEADEITIVITEGIGINIGLSEFMAYYDSNIPDTNNLALECSVNASSYYNETYRPELAVDSKYGLWDEYEWASKGEMTPWIKFRWNSPQLINKVILYDRSNPIDHIKDAWMYLNKYGQRVNSIHLGMFPYGGSAKEVVFDAIETDEITLVVTDGVGINMGLSEFMTYYN